MTTPKVGQVERVTGRYVDPFALTAADLDLRDIAHGLSREGRFGNQTATHYSVAQHSVLMARVILADGGSREAAAYALLHDAAEAFPPGDIEAPLKGRPEYAPLVAMQERNTRLILRHYGVEVSAPMMHAVKAHDTAICLAEAARYMGSRGVGWLIDAPANLVERYAHELRMQAGWAWTPKQAMNIWLCTSRELGITNERKQG